MRCGWENATREEVLEDVREVIEMCSRPRTCPLCGVKAYHDFWWIKELERWGCERCWVNAATVG